MPGSKSETNRALLLAALCRGPGRISGALRARDTELMLAGLRALGVTVTQAGADSLQVDPPTDFHPAPEGIDCGLAGTVMRFLPPVAALATGSTTFHGDPAAARRPLRPLLEGLRQLGVSVNGDALPFTLTGPPGPGAGQVRIDSSASSQFISGLLLSAARFPAGIDLQHLGESVPSAPHIGMTVRMLQDRGVDIEELGATRWRVRPGPIQPRDVVIEPDLTNAAAFLVAGVITGGAVTVRDWPVSTIQPGAMIADLLSRFGACVDRVDGGLRASSCAVLEGTEVDLHEASELTPVVAALACAARGWTTITGVAHIRGHETDRLAAISTELDRLGIGVQETADGLRIHGRGADLGTLSGGLFHCYADHRMAQLGALLGLLIGGLRLDEPESFAKTMPDFTDRWQRMVDPG